MTNIEISERHLQERSRVMNRPQLAALGDSHEGSLVDVGTEASRVRGILPAAAWEKGALYYRRGRRRPWGGKGQQAEPVESATKL